jgi:hypothetical protein
MLRNAAAVGGGVLTFFVLQLPVRWILGIFVVLLFIRQGTSPQNITVAALQSLLNNPAVLFLLGLGFGLLYFASGYVAARIAVRHRLIVSAITAVASCVLSKVLLHGSGSPDYPKWFSWLMVLVSILFGVGGGWLRERQLAWQEKATVGKAPPIAAPE